MGSGFGFHVDIHDYQLCAAAKAKSTDFSHLLHQLFLSGQVNPQLRSRLIRGFACTNDATLFNHILDQAIGVSENIIKLIVIIIINKIINYV